MTTRPSPTGRRRVRSAAAIAVLIAIVTTIVVPALPQQTGKRVDQALFAAAVLCLAVVTHGAWRNARRQTEPAVGHAVGGPCDGQRVQLTGPGRPPALVWLTGEADPAALAHRYAYDSAADDQVRYVYAPLS